MAAEVNRGRVLALQECGGTRGVASMHAVGGGLCACPTLAAPRSPRGNDPDCPHRLQ